MTWRVKSTVLEPGNSPDFQGRCYQEAGSTAFIPQDHRWMPVGTFATFCPKCGMIVKRELVEEPEEAA